MDLGCAKLVGLYGVHESFGQVPFLRKVKIGDLRYHITEAMRRWPKVVVASVYRAVPHVLAGQGMGGLCPDKGADGRWVLERDYDSLRSKQVRK